MSKTTMLMPRMSEKAYATSETGVYVVDVPTDMNKHSIADAINAQFGVKVASVRTANVKGKAKRTIAQKGRRVMAGRQNDFKKAYVTLEKGQSLPFFAAVEEAEEKEKATQEKVAKAMEKQTEKQAKEAAKPAKRGFHLPHLRHGARGGDK